MAGERLPDARVAAWPVVEKGGFLWLFFGPAGLPAEERPPVPADYVPELEDPNWAVATGEFADVKTPVRRCGSEHL